MSAPLWVVGGGLRGPGAPFATSETLSELAFPYQSRGAPGRRSGWGVGWCAERRGAPARAAAGASRARVGWPGASARAGRWTARVSGRAQPGRARAQAQSGAARRARCPAEAEHRKRAARTGGGGPANSSEASAGGRSLALLAARPPARCERARGASGAPKRGWGEPAAAPDVVVRSLAPYQCWWWEHWYARGRGGRGRADACGSVAPAPQCLCAGLVVGRARARIVVVVRLL